MKYIPSVFHPHKPSPKRITAQFFITSKGYSIGASIITAAAGNWMLLDRWAPREVGFPVKIDLVDGRIPADATVEVFDYQVVWLPVEWKKQKTEHKCRVWLPQELIAIGNSRIIALEKLL